MHDYQEKVGPYGESVASDTYRNRVQSAARDALDLIADYGRGAIDPLSVCKGLVGDRYLREIAPPDLFLGFRAVDSEFDFDLHESRAHLYEPAYWAELCAGRDAYFAREGNSIDSDCAALAAYLEQWRRDHPPHGDAG